MPDAVEQAAAGVADGRDVDWKALGTGAGPGEQRERLACLRLIEEIARLHRSSGGMADTVVRSDATDHGMLLPAPDTASTWGRYRLHDAVGEGSFGSVHRAWDPQLEREVAVKILHRRVSDRHLRDQLLREGRALARVRHPNVVSVFGVEFQAERVALCMEFVPGETLDEALRAEGPMDARAAARACADVCRALAAVHAAGFVHRDVKARNVMREESGRIVLMDFGTGREASQLEASGQMDLSGTPLYMAPEVLDGVPASARSDLYSVGVLLYHLVTGAYPVEAASMDALRAAHAANQYVPITSVRGDLPLAFARIVEEALTPDLRERYASADAMLEALERFEGGSALRQAGAMPIVRLVATVLSIVALALLLAAPLGYISSAVFNLVLERFGFTEGETLRSAFLLGLRASVLPVFLLILGASIVAMLLAARRVALAVSGRVARLDRAALEALKTVAHRYRLDDPALVGSGVLMLSAAGLVLGWGLFMPLVDAVTRSISTAPPDALAPLAPTEQGYQEAFRVFFSGHILMTIGAWALVFRIAGRSGRPVHRGLVAGGSAVLILALVTFDAPYRLIFDNSFGTATWQGRECYLLGERDARVLIYCPELAAPRVRVRGADDDALTRSGIVENVFTRRPSGGR